MFWARATLKSVCHSKAVRFYCYLKAVCLFRFDLLAFHENCYFIDQFKWEKLSRQRRVEVPPTSLL